MDVAKILPPGTNSTVLEVLYKFLLITSVTVRLISIVHPQIEGKFTVTPGGLTSVFYGCID